MKATKLPSLILAAALQVLPMTRVFVAATPAAAPSYAVISTWIAGAVALLGSYHAVSGASSISISPASATAGVPYSGIVQYSGANAGSARSWQLINNWKGAQSGCNTAYEIAPGLWLTNAPTYLVRVGGTPTTSGTFSFTMRIHSVGGCGGGDSDTRSATITINGGSAVAPTITTQPIGQTVTAGGSASFAVVASGTAPLNYQWRLNGVNVSGATSSTLALNSVTSAQAGSYTVIVNNSAGSITSSPAILIVNPALVPPAIISQPVGQTVTAGANVSFSVAASGSAPLGYQWRFNGANLSGATGSGLNLTGVTASQAGSYTVVVNNSAGSVTSTPAILIVNPASVAPTIIMQPVDQSVIVGANVSFSVTANGTAPLAYQWRRNGANVSGATSPTLNLTGVTTNSSGSYTVVVNNSAGSVTSSPAILIVNVASVAPTIITQPVSQTVAAGASASFSVTANGTAPLAYQWQRNGANVSGATSSSLALTGVTTNHAGAYTVVVNNSAGSVTSSPALLTVTVPPVNNAPGISAIANQGIYVNTSTGPVSFNVSDNETPAANLTVSAVSSNTALITASGIVLGGSGANRTVTLTPVAGQTGTAPITITVSDGSATTSISFQLIVQNTPPPPSTNGIFIATNGIGTISPNLNAQTLVHGKTYTVTAVPGQGQVFAGWTGSTNTSAAALRFVMASNLAFVANFIPSPYIPVAGNYSGLFYENDEVRQESAGYFDLSVTTRGTYSGKLQLDGSSLKLSGVFDLQRRATNIITRKNTNNLVVQLRVGAEDAAGQVFGQVSDGNWVSTLLGDRAVFNAKTNPAPYATNYTLAVPGQDDGSSAPTGDGSGTVQVKTSGQVSFAGALADGTKLSQSARVSADGYWPLYVPLYSKRGLLLGWMTFTNQPDDDLSGTLCWIKQTDPRAKFYLAGFTNECETVGSIYTAPNQSTSTTLPNRTRAKVSFIGGNLARNITNSIAIGSDSRVATSGDDDDDGDYLSLAFSTSKGTYNGKMMDPTTRKSFNFQGVVLQKRNVGVGFMLGTNQSSKVVIEPQTWQPDPDDDDDDD